MSFVTHETLKESYDVIVVGSGAAGGQTAYTLTMEGASVLMIEAGRKYVPEIETPMFQTGLRAPLRGTSTTDKPFGFYDATVDGGWNVPGEPFTNASSEPGHEFTWWRARMLGGRTNHWARNALRNGPYDFKPYSRDGLGFDWPISYEDVAPYYDKVEMLIGVYGSNEGLENTPDSPEGVLLPAPKLRVGELLAQKHAKQKLGVPIIPIHRAVLSKRLDDQAIPAKLHPNNPKAQRILANAMQGRSACLWATSCGRGCSVRANYQSTTVHLPPAIDTGNLDILVNAMVREVLVNDAGKAEGVSYVDKSSGVERRAHAKVVVLSASACETARVLLNSKSPRFPNGVANSSGRVGRYIMDTVGASVYGQVPALEEMPPHNEDGAGEHAYAPWWLYKEQLAGKLNFARGYHIEFGSGRGMPGLGTGAGLEGLTQGSYGRQYKKDVRRYYGSFMGFSGRGEMIPNANSFCEIDPNVKDRYGIPVLRFHWKWSEHELNQALHMQQTFAAMLESMGGKAFTKIQTDGAKAISPGGYIIHEVGGAMMGADAKKSVTNQFGQTWDVKNLFVTDGALFCSNADKNPTLTIMALAWRCSDYLLQELKKGNL